MRFLPKDPEVLHANRGLRYESTKDRNAARDLLIRLQSGFCAYSERYLKPLDSVEIEHFDPRLKHTASDHIGNWHAVLRWMNAHKARKIESYLPLPDPGDSLLRQRIWFERGEFVCAPEDTEARRLIEFLGVNRPEVTEERSKHVARVRRIMELCPGGVESILRGSPEDLSFPSALEAELGIPAFALIQAVAEPPV